MGLLLEWLPLTPYVFHYLLLEYHVSFMLFYLNSPSEEHNYGIKTRAIYAMFWGYAWNINCYWTVKELRPLILWKTWVLLSLFASTHFQILSAFQLWCVTISLTTPCFIHKDVHTNLPVTIFTILICTKKPLAVWVILEAWMGPYRSSSTSYTWLCITVL